MTLDFFTQTDIIESFNRISAIIKSGIFSEENFQHPLLKSAFIETILSLSDLLQKCKNYDARICFIDDVHMTSSIRDITDLVRFIRNAICHIDSPSHYSSANKVSFNVFSGNNLNAINIGGVSYGCKYNDDTCFIFGEQIIYLHRHIERAFAEAKVALAPLLDDQFNILID